MNIDPRIEGLLNALNPVVAERESDLVSHSDAIWMNIVSQHDREVHGVRSMPLRVSTSRYVPSRQSGIRVLASMAAAAVALVGVLVGTTPSNAIAAELQTAAHNDAVAANLPHLLPGQYYYQESKAMFVCLIGSPSQGANDTPITYISTGAVANWTDINGKGQTTISPATVLNNGSHFATADDLARWIAADKPFVPCALGDARNKLDGNKANANPTSAGGFVATFSGYLGFGFVLTSTATNTLTRDGANINALPSDVASLSQLLANGQISTNGSLATSPQSCPLSDGTTASTGCSFAEQLAIIEQLLQMPDASAKLGAALYGVMSNMPGAFTLGTVKNAYGIVGNTVVVPTSATTQFEAVIDPITGALLSVTAQIANSSDPKSFTPEGTISFGPVTVVTGMTAPSSSTAVTPTTHASSVGSR